MKRSEREEILRDPAAKGYSNTGRTKRVIRNTKKGVVEYNYNIFKDVSTGKEIRIQTSSNSVRRSRGQVINKKNFDKVVNDISKDAHLDNATKRTLKSKLEALLDEKIESGEKLYMSSVAGVTKNYLTTMAITDPEELEGLSSRKKITAAIYNTGELPEDLAARLSAQSGKNITEDDLLNPDNWIGSAFVFQGARWNFRFSYNDEVLVRTV